VHGVIFGATMSDIAGNAFPPVLFLFGTLLSNQALLPDSEGPDLFFIH
jgi:hypothetical protein